MTTLKITKKPSDTTATTKAPVRRSTTITRDRSVAPAKPQRPSAPEASSPMRASDEQRAPRQSADRQDRPRQDRPYTDSARQDAPRQRNHRHDGTLHSTSREQTPDSRAPSSRPINPDARKPDARKLESMQTTRDRADREGAYRNPPRRGGKVRDGFVASEFDKTRTNKEAFAAKANASQPDLPRLSKVMAERGLCSRREADEWISNGWVKVDGEIIETLGTRIKPDAEIIISSYAQEYQAENVTIILHKPVGYVSGQAEDGYQPAIVLVHPDNQWEDDPELHKHNPKQFHRGMLQGLAPAGRLDIDSTGMLVLTQDGRIARHLIGEDSTVEKEYLVRVTGELSDADMKRLNYGLSLDGEKLKPAKVSWQNEDQLRFVLREGKKRQIRRMCEMVGLHVVGLKRIRMGSITLGKLPVGQWRYLRSDERF
ncbi:pseudouridine synthase [Methylotenera mobilis]|uniref:Dual-specificity RNA pseudouridine synthase RluF n=1 Tax=Methylotenera mobilis (strain JLW8 / ATCC BAA-1282 / DSM 17540) TaxID=583345 RepID=C6WY47_METML|nr:pseudouridine synthase [Methylotenera mobilis]ACT46943.1 RNA-binding S4 domain protein [Methylotenera mobilis JLW8]